MKPLGRKFTRVLEGHQNCLICREEHKPPNRCREKIDVRKEIEMETPKLTQVFESVFHGQVYKIDGVGYDVPSLTYFCAENFPAEDVPLANLVMSKSDEKHGTKDFKKHAKKVDHKTFPIVVVAKNDGTLQIADGNHRAWKAAEAGEKTIKGYVIPQDMLPAEAVVEPAEEKESE